MGVDYHIYPELFRALYQHNTHHCIETIYFNPSNPDNYEIRLHMKPGQSPTANMTKLPRK